jgi:hypothetical protein
VSPLNTEIAQDSRVGRSAARSWASLHRRGQRHGWDTAPAYVLSTMWGAAPIRTCQGWIGAAPVLSEDRDLAHLLQLSA